MLQFNPSDYNSQYHYRYCNCLARSLFMFHFVCLGTCDAAQRANTLQPCNPTVVRSAVEIMIQVFNSRFIYVRRFVTNNWIKKTFSNFFLIFLTNLCILWHEWKQRFYLFMCVEFLLLRIGSKKKTIPIWIFLIFLSDLSLCIHCGMMITKVIII